MKQTTQKKKLAGSLACSQYDYLFLGLFASLFLSLSSGSFSLSPNCDQSVSFMTRKRNLIRTGTVFKFSGFATLLTTTLNVS
jgi:hypothetical protein